MQKELIINKAWLNKGESPLQQEIQTCINLFCGGFLLQPFPWTQEEALEV